MYLILNASQLKAILTTPEQVVSTLTDIKNRYVQAFQESSAYSQRNYICSENYAASFMHSVRVIYVQNREALNDLSWIMFFGRSNHYNQANWIDAPEGVRDFTDVYLSVEQLQYEATTKVFATVTKRGIKSFGMDVILDPSLHSDELRSVEYYQELIGTFARVKATTNIRGYGIANLFLAPESLGNIRMETQVIDGFRVTIL